MRPLLFCSLLCLFTTPFAPGATVHLGDGAAQEADVVDGVADTANDGDITYAFTAHSHTNSSGEPMDLRLTDVHFWAAASGTLIPFVALYNGGSLADAESYDVLAIGDAIAAQAGQANHAAFTVDGAPFTLTLAPDEELVVGFHQSAGIVPFTDGGSADYLQMGNTLPNALPDSLIGDAQWSNLGRTYAFNIAAETGPAEARPPTDIQLSTLSIFAGFPVGGILGEFTTTDPDPSDNVFTYTLVPGDGDGDNGKFEIQGPRLHAAEWLGEEGTQLAIRVRSTDPSGLSFEKSFALSVVPGQAPTDIVLGTSTVPDGAAAGSLVGSLSAIDPDTGDQHAFALVAGEGDTHNALFAVDGAVLQVAGALPGAGTELSIRIEVTDLSGATFARALPLTVGRAGFHLSEFMADNGSHLRDEDEAFSDWIEISNDQATEANIGGWFLTDDPDNLTKWRFPDRAIPGRGHLLVFASGKDRASALDPELHTNFALNAGGEYLALVEPDGETIATAFAPTFPAQFEDISYGLDANRTREGFFFPPTPEDANGEPVESGVNIAILSHHRGFYSEPFQLEMTPSIAGSTIRYSTTGARPSLFNAFTYSAPITISQTTTLRVVSSKDGGPPSRVTTHTFIFLDDVIAQPAMSSSITEHSTWGPMMKESLLDIPTMSVVTNANLTSGVSPEVETSLELIHPDGTTGFQVDCGVEHFGGHTLDNSPKKNMRFSFKSRYGPPRLRYDLFGGDAATSFDQILLRTGSHDNWFWTHPSGRTGIFIRGRWAFDRSLEMGQPAPRGRWVHVYINGSYQGLHHLMERPNNAFMASYFGGEKEDYEALVAGTPVDGDGSVWRALTTSTGDYEALRKLIDLENYADYMLVQFYGGNDWDWNTAQNWSAASGKLPDPDPGYQFFHWDSDVILRSGREANVIDRGGPGNLWSGIKAHEEFRVMLADRAYRYFLNGGMLTTERVFAQFEELAARIDKAVIAECARWGAPSGYTPQRWREAIDNVKETIVDGRAEIVLEQMQAAGVYPNTSPPKLNQAGGSVPDGFVLNVSKPSIFAAGTAYFTLDGNDPRQPGGAPHPSSQSTDNAIDVALERSVTLKARFRSPSGEWSPLLETFFAVDARPPRPGDLLVSEIHFNPQDGESTEFIELANAGDANLILDKLAFVDGIDFVFPPHTVLEAGGFLVVAGDDEAFAQRYLDSASPWYRDGIAVAGAYEGSLSNGGERLELVDAEGDPLFAFAYSDSGNWPERGDGDGSSLELVDLTAAGQDLETVNAYLDQGSQWRASSELHGSPGHGGSGPAGSIVINEVLNHPLTGGLAAVELFNPTDGAVDLSGWFLSDGGDYQKYRFPPGTTLAPGALLSLDESAFDRSGPNTLVPFSLDPHGEGRVYFVEGDAAGNAVRFIDAIAYRAAAAGESFGRWPDGTGNLQPMRQDTLGERNDSQGNAPRVGPVMVTEIHYNPEGEDDFGLEFVEIFNSGTETEALSNWRLRGEADVDLGQEELAPGGLLVFVAFDPATASEARDRFLAAYPEVAQARLRGPWQAGGGNRLNNGGGVIRLQRAGEPQTDSGGRLYFPMLVEDTVHYDDDAPWTTEADGSGLSLHRIDLSIHGDDPANWQASLPTPGTHGGTAPGLTFTQWRDAFGLGDGPEGAPQADFDGDAILNFLEFAFNSDPTRATPEHLPTARLGKVIVDGETRTQLTIQFRRRRDRPDLDYSPRISQDLVIWQPAEGQVTMENIDATTRLVTIRVAQSAEQARQFVQLRVTD